MSHYTFFDAKLKSEDECILNFTLTTLTIDIHTGSVYDMMTPLLLSHARGEEEAEALEGISDQIELMEWN